MNFAANDPKSRSVLLDPVPEDATCPQSCRRCSSSDLGQGAVMGHKGPP